MNCDVLNTLDIYEELMSEVAKEMKEKLDNIEENKPVKPRVKKEKVEYKKEDITGYSINIPKIGTLSYEHYTIIVDYLKDKKAEWVSLITLRRLISNKKVQITLHDKSKNNSNKGLLWRQLAGKNTLIEYCLV